MTKASLFQTYCEKAIAKLSDEDIEKFKSTTRDDERIKMMYDYAKTIPINPVKNGKSYELAENEKLKGNKLFAAKKYDDAVKCYNSGIILCPQDTEPNRELLTILVSNRSACLFELEQYRRVFDDIEYVLAIGSYPPRLHHKMWLRKAKCYDALQNPRYAAETYELALASLKHANLDAPGLLKKQAEIENSRKSAPKPKPDPLPVCVSNADRFVGGNAEFVAAHRAVFFDYDPLLGRFARAAEDLETGAVIVEEGPHCSALAQENSLTNCQHCCVSTGQPIACGTCAHAVFCSLGCERQAGYHRYECAIRPVLFASGASINCQLALRMVSQRPLAFFQQKRKQLKDFLKDNCKKVPIKCKVYRADDYLTAFFLCRNEQLRKKGELVHFSAMAIYLVRLLRFGNYFGGNGEPDGLSDDETFVGCLILRHLQILQYNSHEISEIRATTQESNIDGIETRYKNEYIGAALYPTLALFNHSCDPSIVRYNVGSRIVARAIKPIKAGDVIYENYGPIYTSMPIKERKQFLQERYRFECYCTPCQDEWPRFESMNPNQIKIGCQTDKCPFEFTLHKDDLCPYMQCDYCNTMTKIFPCLRGLSELAVLLPKAENLYSAGENREAMKIFMQSLDILFKFSRPPCPDMVKVQQRLRTLFLHLGNKQVGYVDSL